MAAEGDPVEEGCAGLVEGLRDPFMHEHRSHGCVAGGESLGDRDEVGPTAVDLDPEPFTYAPEARNHLVGHEQDSEAIADLTEALPIAGRRHEAATRILD